MFQMMGAFAEIERSMISERVKSGLARAKGNGKTLGSPEASKEVEKQILQVEYTGKRSVSIAKLIVTRLRFLRLRYL